MTTTLTILGCGSSGGVPRLGNNWGKCDPTNPKNARMRCSVLIQKEGPKGTTRVLIDTSPDMRQQLLNAGVGNLDAVVFTHEHADHTHGLDDLRMIVINQRAVLDVYAPPRAQPSIFGRFAYAFEQPKGSPYPPILNMEDVDSGPLEINGAGGPIELTPIVVEHGTIDAMGYRIGNVAYLPDVSDIPRESIDLLQGLDVWIVDCLREDFHPSHFNLEASLNWIEKIKPKQAILTNLHVDLDYDDLDARTANHITPAFDGRVVQVND